VRPRISGSSAIDLPLRGKLKPSACGCDQLDDEESGVSFRHAVQLLKAGDFSSLVAQPVKSTTVTKLATPLDASAEDQPC
jgi:hypothetical protein